MISSQLGRIILKGSSNSSSDEMRFASDAECDPIDQVLDDVASHVRAEPAPDDGDRRAGD